jgi:septal ring factor EnvC (AmiA/AmiB activator)
MLVRIIMCFGCFASASLAGTSELTSDVQRLQQQRAQQQLELQLKMQQQQDRAARAAGTPEREFTRRQLERDQQQRQQQTHEQDSRSTLAAPVGDAAQSAHLEIERADAERKGVEQLQRFERERRIESERAPPAESAPRRNVSD